MTRCITQGCPLSPRCKRYIRPVGHIGTYTAYQPEHIEGTMIVKCEQFVEGPAR